MKKLLLFVLPFILSPLIIGCDQVKKNSNGYGVFLGAHDADTNKIMKYDAVCIDIDEFSETSIKKLKNNHTKIYAYLSIGSLEKYRSYYDDFKDITFMDYENWPDERWVDVSNTLWQSHISNEADRLKSLGADGLFMDNFDVYYFASEEYAFTTEEFKEGIFNGCYTILDDLTKKDLKLMINSGTDFLERCKEMDKITPADKIDVYAQECVFSNIEDYENDVFGRQEKEQQDYLFEMIDMMKAQSEVLLIEYTKDKEVVKDIKDYCLKNKFSYYISNNIALKA